MTFPSLRILLIAVIVFSQLQPNMYCKPPKPNENRGLAYVSFPGQPNPARSLLDVLVIQKHWDNGDLVVGSSQRIKLRFVKAGDQVTAEGTLPRYRVFAEGVPENKVYEWAVWQGGEDPKRDSGDIYVNARGLLLTHKPRPEEESVLEAPGSEFQITPVADSAVPLRYGLYSRDEQVAIPGTFVPQPVASSDQGCRLEVRIAQPNATAVLFVADGFPPESEVPLLLDSEGETANVIMNTDSSGRAIVAGFPYVQGKTRGNIKATAEGPACLPSVSLPWGASEAHLAQKTP